MKRPSDPNELAKRVVDAATGAASDKDLEPKGRQLSGLARAASMTPEQRRALAKKAAAARWGQRD